MNRPEQASSFNALEELISSRRPPTQLLLNDVTLREGEQSSGVSFSLDQKVELARALELVGVRQVQVGYPGRFQQDLEATLAVAGVLDRAEVEVVALAFVSDWEDEIDACLRSGASVVNVVYRASDRLLNVLGVSPDDALRRTREAVGRAVSGGLRVAFSPSDSTRADPDFVVRLWQTAAAEGASRVYVPDSVGAASPDLVKLLVERAQAATSLPVGVHCHNDFGLAVGNTIAGVMAGAEIADVAVNGLGDRAGNSPLEEVAVALELVYELDTGIGLERLTALSQRFARASDRPLPPNKPVTGTDVFAHVLPTHTSAMRADARAIQPYEPELVGNEQRIEPRERSESNGT